MMNTLDCNVEELEWKRNPSPNKPQATTRMIMKKIDLEKDEIQFLTSYLSVRDIVLAQHMHQFRTLDKNVFEELSVERRMVQGLINKLMRPI
jgi:hypothetical protein